jgi:hypothetical protein
VDDHGGKAGEERQGEQKVEGAVAQSLFHRSPLIARPKIGSGKILDAVIQRFMVSVSSARRLWRFSHVATRVWISVRPVNHSKRLRCSGPACTHGPGVAADLAPHRRKGRCKAHASRIETRANDFRLASRVHRRRRAPWWRKGMLGRNLARSCRQGRQGPSRLSNPRLVPPTRLRARAMDEPRGDVYHALSRQPMATTLRSQNGTIIPSAS